MARLRGARHVRHGPRAYAALRGMVAALHPSALKNRLPLRKAQQGDASAAFEAGDDIDAGFIDNDASSASQVHVVDKKPAPKTGRRAAREAQTKLAFDKSTYELPPLRLLTEHKKPRQTSNLSKDALEANARMLETVLADFGIKGTIGQVRGARGDTYELEPAAGVRSSRVVGLADDIARSMSAVSARVAPVPGSNVIGIELPQSDARIGFFARAFIIQRF